MEVDICLLCRYNYNRKAGLTSPPLPSCRAYKIAKTNDCYHYKPPIMQVIKRKLFVIKDNLKDMLTDNTWVGNLNVYLLQWFFFRLSYQWVKITPKCILPIKPLFPSYRKGNFCIIFPIIPLTGWWSDYKPKKHYTINFYKEQK